MVPETGDEATAQSLGGVENQDAGRTPPASDINVTRAIDRARTVRKRRRLAVAAGAVVVLAAGVTFALSGLPPVDRAPAPAGSAAADPVQTQLDRNLMQALIGCAKSLGQRSVALIENVTKR